MKVKDMSLGELLKDLRGDEGLRDAAKRMEITYSYLAMLEKGTDWRTGKPLKQTPLTLQQIASAYKYDYMKLIEAGVDLNFIMNRVGHKNSETTTKIYLHVTSGMRENASQKMHAKFTQLLTDCN